MLGKFEFDDDTGEFFFEEGVCADTVWNIDYVNKEDEENEPIEVTFNSPIFIEDVSVKFGRNCELASESDEVSFTQNEEKDSNGFESTISLDDPRGPAISHFNLCAGICMQVDFIIGEPTDDPADYNLGDELISVNWESTAGDVGSSSKYPLTDDHVVTDDGDVIESGNVLFNESETTASVTFDLTLNSEDVTLTLVSYSATCPPHFDEDTAHIQDQYQATTKTYTSGGEDLTLEVGVPGLDLLDELCDI